jgi:uncharacterized membrane protein YheB (UPF0754 family)
MEMEMQNWKIDFNWIKAHAGHHGNELADQLAKEAATSREINECYKKIPKSAVLSELSEHSATKWQGEWNHTTKGATTKLFFPKIADRLKLKINLTSTITTMVTGHGNIKLYLHKHKILDSPMRFCKNGEQTVDHILFDCKLLEQERDSLKAAVLRSENWPVSKNKLITKFNKTFQQFTNSISFDKPKEQ